MGHHAKALRRIHEYDVVRYMRARLRRRGTADQRRRVDLPRPAGAFLHQVRCAAGRTKAAVEILRLPARAAGLVDDGFFAFGPVREFAAHRTRSKNMLTCDDSTPPSPCSSAIEASRTWRLPARPVICN